MFEYFGLIYNNFSYLNYGLVRVTDFESEVSLQVVFASNNQMGTLGVFVFAKTQLLIDNFLLNLKSSYTRLLPISIYGY